MNAGFLFFAGRTLSLVELEENVNGFMSQAALAVSFANEAEQ